VISNEDNRSIYDDWRYNQQRSKLPNRAQRIQRTKAKSDSNFSSVCSGNAIGLS